MRRIMKSMAVSAAGLVAGAGLAVAGWTVAAQATPAAAKTLPIARSASLSSSGQDSSILKPARCSVSDGTVTATGSYTGLVYESYVRYGDVVELYAFTATRHGARDQDLALAGEHPSRMGTSKQWKVTATVDTQVGAPVFCRVAVQSTHAFMAAGNAGG
ncbi:MAG TPA: hypothetical protein VKV06_03005 [Acidimicrobiales bacterium]|nr:hypothetical protein [Acidimicrobiales bacterium]